jgi:hypothetical protein
MSVRRGSAAAAGVLVTANLVLFALAPVTSAWNAAAGLVVAEDTGFLGGLWLLSWFGFFLVGGALVANRPKNPIGWILCLIPLSIAVTIVAENVALRHAAVGEVRIVGGFATWAAFWTAIPALALVPFLVLLFPSGTVESVGWRRAGRVAAVVAVLLLLSYAVRPTMEPLPGVVLVNPVGMPAAGHAIDQLIVGFSVLLVGFGMLVAGHAVWRYRRSTGVERQQLRWFAAAVPIFPIIMALAAGVDAVAGRGSGRRSDLLVVAAFLVGFNGVAVAIGVAVTRYRLYDIDRLVSRTIGYALVTTAVVGVYAGVVLTAQVLLGPTNAPDAVVAAGTLLAAALFRPLHRRVQSRVDRRFDRRAYDAARIIAAFSHRLRDQIDLEPLLGELHDTIHQTMTPTTVTVWVSPDVRT